MSTTKPRSSTQIKDDLLMTLVCVMREIAPPDMQRAIDRKIDELNEAHQREEYERYDV